MCGMRNPLIGLSPDHHRESLLFEIRIYTTRPVIPRRFGAVHIVLRFHLRIDTFIPGGVQPLSVHRLPLIILIRINPRRFPRQSAVAFPSSC